MSNRAKGPALVFPAKRMGGILQDKEGMLLREVHDRIHVHRIAPDVHRYDHLRLPCDLARHIVRIHVQGPRVHVGKHDFRPDGKWIGHGGDEGNGRNDDLVSRGEIRVSECNFKSGGSVGDEHAPAGTDGGIDQLLQLAHVRAQRQLARRVPEPGESAHGFLHVVKGRHVFRGLALHEETNDVDDVIRAVGFANGCPGNFRVPRVVPEIAH